MDLSEVAVTIEDNSNSLTRARRQRTITDEVKGELREIFDLFMDLDTGRVTARQVEEMMKVYGYHPKKEQLERVFRVCGVRRRDQGITYEKFETIMAKLISQRNAVDGIMKAFELFDIHNDGCITFTSLCEISRMMSTGFSDDNVLDMIVEADIDRDGIVDIRDFTAMMKQTDIDWYGVVISDRPRDTEGM